LSNTNTSTLEGNPVLWVVAFQFIMAVLICLSVHGYFQPYYCRCTSGFLVLKRGDPPKLLHAVRWDDVTGTRRVSTVGGGILTTRYKYYVSTRHGKEIRIVTNGNGDRSTDIWYYCDEQVSKRARNCS